MSADYTTPPSGPASRMGETIRALGALALVHLPAARRAASQYLAREEELNALLAVTPQQIQPQAAEWAATRTRAGIHWGRQRVASGAGPEIFFATGAVILPDPPSVEDLQRLDRELRSTLSPWRRLVVAIEDALWSIRRPIDDWFWRRRLAGRRGLWHRIRRFLRISAGGSA